MITGRDVWLPHEAWAEWPARFWRIFFSEDRRAYFGSRGFVRAAWISLRLMTSDLLIALGLKPTREERIASICTSLNELAAAMHYTDSEIQEAVALWKTLPPCDSDDRR